MAPTAQRQFVAAIPFLWPLFPLHRRFGLHDLAVFTTCSLTFVSLLMIALVLMYLGLAQAAAERSRGSVAGANVEEVETPARFFSNRCQLSR